MILDYNCYYKYLKLVQNTEITSPKQYGQYLQHKKRGNRKRNKLVKGK